MKTTFKYAWTRIYFEATMFTLFFTMMFVRDECSEVHKPTNYKLCRSANVFGALRLTLFLQRMFAHVECSAHHIYPSIFGLFASLPVPVTCDLISGLP